MESYDEEWGAFRAARMDSMTNTERMNPVVALLGMKEPTTYTRENVQVLTELIEELAQSDGPFVLVFARKAPAGPLVRELSEDALALVPLTQPLVRGYLAEAHALGTVGPRLVTAVIGAHGGECKILTGAARLRADWRKVVDAVVVCRDEEASELVVQHRVTKADYGTLSGSLEEGELVEERIPIRTRKIRHMLMWLLAGKRRKYFFARLSSWVAHRPKSASLEVMKSKIPDGLRYHNTPRTAGADSQRDFLLARTMSGLSVADSQYTMVSSRMDRSVSFSTHSQRIAVFDRDFDDSVYDKPGSDAREEQRAVPKLQRLPLREFNRSPISGSMSFLSGRM
jgi:hypothetical protein